MDPMLNLSAARGLSLRGRRATGFEGPSSSHWTASLLRQILIPSGSADTGELSFQNLSAEQAQSLDRLGGHAFAEELRSLSRESDPKLYFEGLLALGRRVSNEDRLDLAQLVLGFVAELGTEAAPHVAACAQRELDALAGRGASGARFEFLARRFSREAASPAMLFGMAAAGTVFSLARGTLLARLFASPAANVFTRGLGARALAGTGAFLLEAPTFAAATRGARVLLGDPAASATPFSREVASAYLTLGGLKMFGAVGEGALRWTGSGAVSRAFIPQLSMYAGILAGHGLERAVGLRQAQSDETLLLDSLVTLMQFHVGGKLSEQVLGNSFTRFQRGLQLRAEALAPVAETSRNGNMGPWSGFGAGIGESSLAPAAAGPGTRFPLQVMMANSSSVRPGMGEGAASESVAMDAHASGSSEPRHAGEGPPRAALTWGLFEELLGDREAVRKQFGEAPSLFVLLSRRAARGEVPALHVEELKWAAYLRELYEASPILQRKVTNADLLSTELAVTRLAKLRRSVAREQGRDSYSLATLVQALVYGGRIHYSKLRSYLSSAASYDFFQLHRPLQTIRRRNFANPYLLVRRLSSARRTIEARAGQSYKLATLIDALRWHPAFPGTRLQNYLMVAAASDLVRTLPLNRLRIHTTQLESLMLEQIFLRMLKVKPLLRDEEGDPVSIGYVLMGLRSHGLKKVRGGEVNDTVIQHAHNLDYVFNRWLEWGNHFRNLAALPKRGDGVGTRSGWTRPKYAETYLLKENGEPYSASYLSGLVRWGEFLWEHREALGLPTPQEQVVEAAQGDRGRIMEFLRPYWEALRHQQTEDFFAALLGFREQLFRRQAVDSPERPEASPSLMTMVKLFFKSQRRSPTRTLEVYAAMVDNVLQRWQEWRRHFRTLSEIPSHIRRGRGASRFEYAAEHLKQPNGKPYSHDSLHGVVRWGIWLWENRSRLGLRSGDSTMPPPAPPTAAEE